MKELLIIPIITVPIFLLYVYFKYGMTISISATYKELKGWERPWFSVTLWSIAIPIMIVGIENAPKDWVQGLFFFAGSLICLVGASPKFWSGGMEYEAHMIGSYGGIGIGIIACIAYSLYICSLLSLLLLGVYALFIISQMIIKITQIKNYTYWVEIGAIIIVCATLHLNQQ